ncbi:hypothetical protein [Ligilactobacillus agilis]|uniref:hypothetical protein n=1 Tax=Ligilactobacillus agilis TaxID=1601 RepID=UPI00254F0CC9|nr:hypothetical protein [Ligilactobacillus agilis]MDK6810205.1 hypothetical protein [Ligilactobacillus agilis]
MELAGTFWQEIAKTSEELGIKKGREEGREKSYITLVPIFVQKLTEDGYTQDEIISYLETKLALSEEAAQKYYQLAITKA